MLNQTQLNQAIKDEILNDPEGRGYANKTPEEQAALLNEVYYTSQTYQQAQTPRIAVIINQIAEAPNSVTGSDVTTALGG